jgi:hypothetical protein
MENAKTKIQEIKEDTKDLFDHAVDYVETLYRLKTITIAQKAIDIGSGAINAVIIGIFGIFSFGAISFGIGWWLGNLVDNRAAGFFITGGLYALVIFAIIIMRKKLIFPFLRNLLTKKIYE